MRISEIYRQRRRVFSFEFFPPKTDEGFRSLYRTIEKLKNRGPGFVSVTWGAGGSTRRKTVDLVIEIQHKLGITAVAHLSCVDSTREQLEKTLDKLEAGGIENVLALTGDHPPGYTPPPESFEYANELSDFIGSRWNFDISGACYPETHPLASSPEADLENLARKANTGMKALITQLFFDNDCYFEFVERARRRGVPALAVPRKQYPDPGDFNDAIHAELDRHEVDLVACLGFLSPFETRGKFDGRAINVHPALIPAFCGKGYYGQRVHEAVLASGATVTGATVHFVDEEYDCGPIILQEEVAVRADDTPASLAERVQAVERRLVPQAVQLFASGRLAIEGRQVQILDAPEIST